MNRKKTSWSEDSDKDLTSSYDFLLSFVPSKHPQAQVVRAGDLIDDLNKKVSEIRKELQNSIDLQNSLLKTEEESGLLWRNNCETSREIRKKNFLSQNGKNQSTIIRDLKVQVNELVEQIKSLKKQIVTKEKYIEAIEMEIKFLQDIQENQKYLPHHQTATSESDLWPHLTFCSDQIKVVVHSPSIVEEKVLETKKSFQEITAFLEKSLRKQPSLNSLIESRNSIGINSKEFENCSLNKFVSEIKIASQEFSRGQTNSIFTQVKIGVERKKRFNRSPVFNQVQMFKKRLADRY